MNGVLRERLEDTRVRYVEHGTWATTSERNMITFEDRFSSYIYIHICVCVCVRARVYLIGANTARLSDVVTLKKIIFLKQKEFPFHIYIYGVYFVST